MRLPQLTLQLLGLPLALPVPVVVAFRALGLVVLVGVRQGPVPRGRVLPRRGRARRGLLLPRALPRIATLVPLVLLRPEHN